MEELFLVLDINSFSMAHLATGLCHHWLVSVAGD